MAIIIRTPMDAIRYCVDADAPLTYSPITGIFDIPQATAIQDGYLSKEDWAAFNSLFSSGTIDPGHKHSKLWASDGSPEAVTVDAAGNVGFGTATPGADFHLMGSQLIEDSGIPHLSMFRSAAPTNGDNIAELNFFGGVVTQEGATFLVEAAADWAV